jgi:hypothetical protein
MANLVGLDLERNNNPHFLNLLLTYPNRVKYLVAYEIDVYSLDEDINPDSVHNVNALVMKTASFS